MARRKEACSSVLGLNLCFGGFAALYKDPRLRGCAFNMNIQNAVDQHEPILIARKGVDALQELATSSATSGRSQRKRDRQVAQLHAALVTIHDGLEQTPITTNRSLHLRGIGCADTLADKVHHLIECRAVTGASVVQPCSFCFCRQTQLYVFAACCSLGL